MKVPRQTVKLVRDAVSIDMPGKIGSPLDAVAAFRDILKGLPHEEIHVLALDAACRPIGMFMVARGGSSGAGVLPADIFRPLVACAAKAFIMAHNHPSGEAAPSKDDLEMTQRLKQAGALLGIPLVDHLVLTDTDYRSCL